LSQARLRNNGWGIAGKFLQQLHIGVDQQICLLVGAQQLNVRAMSGPLWVGLVLALLGLFEIMAPMMRGASRLGEVQAASTRLLGILDAPLEVQQEQGQAIVLGGPASLYVSDLSFAYGSQPVLEYL